MSASIVMPGLGNSDHQGVYISLKCQLPTPYVQHTGNRTIWRYGHADFNRASQMLDKLDLESIIDENDIELS